MCSSAATALLVVRRLVLPSMAITCSCRSPGITPAPHSRNARSKPLGSSTAKTHAKVSREAMP